MRSTRLSFFWLRHIWGSYSLQKRELGHNFGVISRTSRLVNHNLRQIWLVPNKNVKTQTCFSSLRLFFLDAYNATTRVVAKRSYQSQLVGQTFWSIDRIPLERWVPCIILLHHIHDLLVLSVSFGANHESDTHHFKMKIAHTHIWHCCFASLALKTWVVFSKVLGGDQETSEVSGFPSSRFHRWNPLWHADGTNRTRRWAVHRQQSTTVAAIQCFDSTRVVERQTFHRWQVVGSWMTLPRIIVPVVFSGTKDYMWYSIDLF